MSDASTKPLKLSKPSSSVGRYAASIVDAWDQFWFTPARTETLCVLRILVGLMLSYAHVVMLVDYEATIAPTGWIDATTAAHLQDGTLGPASAAWSYLWSLPGWAVWGHQLLAIALSVAMCVGWRTRWTVPLAAATQLMIVHRMFGTLFGLDQIITYMTLYLAISPCGTQYSLDARRRSKAIIDVPTRYVMANVATRLLQLHLCVIYLFGGLAKARGQMWWDGTALWYSVANAEYQSVDATFLASHPVVFTAMTHVALWFEITYAALIWPRLTRPVILALALSVHLGIAVFLGMITFGLAMIFANLIFLPPKLLSWPTIQRPRLTQETRS